MSNFGHQRERELVNRLRAEDWFALRAPASLGVADVVALKDGVAHMYECKATAAGPYAGFLPADRKRLSEAARKAGALAFLCWWPKRAKPQFIAESDWP